MFHEFYLKTNFSETFLKMWDWIPKIRATSLIKTTTQVVQGCFYSKKSTCRDRTFSKKEQINLKKKQKNKRVRFGSVE